MNDASERNLLIIIWTICMIAIAVVAVNGKGWWLVGLAIAGAIVFAVVMLLDKEECQKN